MKELLDLHAFADGEMSKTESKRIRDFVSSNPEAQAELDSILNLIDCLKQKSSTHRSDECWAVCIGRLNQLDRSKKVETFVGRYAWVMCAILFVFVIGGRYAVKDVHGDTAHTADLIGRFHSSTPDPSQEMAKRQFYADLLRKSKLARSGVRVVSERVGTILDSPVERVDFFDRSGPLTFYVMNGVFNFEDASQISSGSGFSEGLISTPSAEGTNSVHCVIWVDQGRTFVLSGPRSVTQLTSAAVDLDLKTP